MDEDKLLEELRAQRELLQKHLEWLDQKIKQCDDPDTAGNGGPRAAVTEETDAGKNDTTDAEAPESLAYETAAEKPNEPSEEEIDRELNRYNTTSGDPVLRAKLGCFVLFVLSTILFFFLLFGLPYLLD